MEQLYLLQENQEDSLVIVSDVDSDFIKPESFCLGEQFENFVEDTLFPDKLYTLLKRTDTYERNIKRFSESTLDPDFHFRCRLTGQEFAVEAKFRTRLTYKGKLSWCSGFQKERYDKINREKHPVFVIVGLGGYGFSPERVFLFPVRGIKYVNLFMNVAQKYELPSEQFEGISNEFLWRLL